MSTASKVERTAIHLPTQPILGDPSCTTNPTDCCDGGESIAGVVLTVEKRRWTLPAGAWIGETWCEDFETCCDASGSASTGPILTACCDYPLNTTLTCLATIGGITTIYNANWNGSYWVVDHPSMYALRCNGTTWEVGYNSGGMVWTAASGRCTPDFFWGITVGGDSISFVGSAGDESMPGGATYRLRVQKTRVYLPATATVGSPRCVDVPDDCCEDTVSVVCCPGSTPAIGRTVYLAISNVRAGGCTELDGVIIPMAYNATGLNVWAGCVTYKSFVDSVNVSCCVSASFGCFDGTPGTLQLRVQLGQLTSSDIITACATNNEREASVPVDCPAGLLFQQFTDVVIEDNIITPFLFAGCCDAGTTFDAVLFE